jgi:hypothetical protein
VPRPTRGSELPCRIRGCHPLWPVFPDRSAIRAQITGLVRVRSPLLAESLLMSFPPANEMFQFAGFASPAYGFSRRSVRRLGLPHSEIRESTSARLSSRLFAACHVLHRLSVPRHPPNALLMLDLALSQTIWRHTQGQTPSSDDKHRLLFAKRRFSSSVDPRLRPTGHPARQNPRPRPRPSVHTYPQCQISGIGSQKSVVRGS